MAFRFIVTEISLVRVIQMVKEDVKRKVIGILLGSEQPVTLSRLAALTGVSSKTVRNYLAEIEQSGILGSLRLIKKPSVGVCLVGPAVDRAELQNRIPEPKDLVYSELSPEARRYYILKTLFKNRYTYTIQLLADDLYVSKSTVVQDLTCVQQWLEKRGLKLQRKPNRGLWIEGDEYIFRNAMIDLYSEAQKAPLVLPDQEIEKLDYRIDFVNYTKIKQLFPRLDLYGLQTILQQAEQKLGYCFTDEAFINLVVHIAIAVERVKQGKQVIMDEDRLERLAGSEEFDVARWMVIRIEELFGSNIPLAEVGYISLHLLGARVQRSIRIDNLQEVLAAEDQAFIELADRITHVVSDILRVDLTKDKLLSTGLVLHLRPMVMRVRYGIKLRNPLLERIKREYTSIFGATWATNEIFESLFGITVGEDEISYIAMHIGAAAERLKRKIKTVVMCASGLGTSQLIAIKLERALPELEITAIISATNYNNQDLVDSADLIISTVPLKEKGGNMVCISTLVDSKDIMRIQGAIKGRRTKNEPFSTPESLREIVSAELCFARETLRSREAIIRKYGGILEQLGYVCEGFIDNAVQREKITSTEIGKGIAIPHGADEYVNESKICVITLTEPVRWGSGEVDVVILLALKFRSAPVSRLFFEKLYDLLEDEDRLCSIKQAETGLVIADIILGENDRLCES